MLCNKDVDENLLKREFRIVLDRYLISTSSTVLLIKYNLYELSVSNVGHLMPFDTNDTLDAVHLMPPNRMQMTS